VSRRGVLVAVVSLLLGSCRAGTSGSNDALRSPEAAPHPCGDVSTCERECASGDGGACHAAGTRYELGQGTEQDYPRAADLYAHGCELGAASACNNLGIFYEIGLSVEQSDARAAELYERSCSTGDSLGCENERRSSRRK
jgi:TPR repeat protein